VPVVEWPLESRRARPDAVHDRFTSVPQGLDGAMF
jgi:hypothetical protein